MLCSCCPWSEFDFSLFTDIRTLGRHVPIVLLSYRAIFAIEVNLTSGSLQGAEPWDVMLLFV